MDVAQISNDARGWIMCVVSGVACVAGASIICVDVLVRQIPSKRHFRIQNSSVFLACSLSLSFGVMLYSALVGMLPASKNYLIKGAYSPTAAEWTRLGCFVAGFLGIQIISRFLHQFIPSDVVGCDHTHAEGPFDEHTLSHAQKSSHSHSGHQSRDGKRQVDGRHKSTESTPLLNGENGSNDLNISKSQKPTRQASFKGDVSEDYGRRASIAQVQTRVMSFVKDTKTNCDENGPCYGYTDPCGRECFKRIRGISPLASRRSTVACGPTGGPRSGLSPANIPQSSDGVIDGNCAASVQPPLANATQSHEITDHAYEPETADGKFGEDLEAQHHHHVPTNAFMAIGLQTSIAIALHKLPEGFITYATNHANPSLGLTVFMALFIHSITEGFAMALPLYLALGSRFQAMFWSSLLGGFSQPFGAGIAALWFRLARDTDHVPGFVAYGCMFAVTAGIMASVALALFVESLSVNHNTQLCIASALAGMAILGMSSALTA